MKTIVVAAAGLVLTGCVAAVPVQSTLTVIPGQGKTEADLRADDTACRRGTAAATATSAAVTSEQYYACMAAKGEAVIEQQTQVYPTYAGYAAYGYPAYAYGYPYPYGGYPYGFGYPYGAGYPYGGYFGPYVGFGIGFGYGGFYGRGWRGGYGGWHGGYGGYRGGYGGGFHGGGHRR